VFIVGGDHGFGAKGQAGLTSRNVRMAAETLAWFAQAMLHRWRYAASGSQDFYRQRASASGRKLFHRLECPLRGVVMTAQIGQLRSFASSHCCSSPDQFTPGCSVT